MQRNCWLCGKPVKSGGTWMLPKSEELGDPELTVLIHDDCKGYGSDGSAFIMVPSPADMGKENFRKHFNLRHADSLGGLSELDERFDANLWWRFHRRLHEIRIDLNHEHKEPENGNVRR